MLALKRLSTGRFMSALIDHARLAEIKKIRELHLGRLNLCSVPSFNPITSTLLENDRIKMYWQNGEQSEFHNVWLRDHCRCSKCLNQVTHQRELDLLDVPLDIKPSKITTSGNGLKLEWPDGHVTVFSSDWLMKHRYQASTQLRVDDWVEPILWNKSRISTIQIPKITYESVVSDEKECCMLSNLIEKYGFAFVHEMPTDLLCIEKLCNALGGFVLETHYGRLWSFSNEVMDHADTAYTAQGLQAHTDGTYLTNPVGLQMLHCTGHKGKGGESLLVDGFYAAEVLKQKDFKAFKYLSSQPIPFHFKDASIHLKAFGPVIEVNPLTNKVSSIRFNMYDRDILNCLPVKDIPKFYQAIKSFASIIRNPESEHVFKLVPGLMLVMANWRVMHGRSGFTGLRKLQGCYVNRDYFYAQFRPKYKIYKNKLG